MIDAAHGAVWSDAFWTINSRMRHPKRDLSSGQDFEPIWPMIRTEITGSSGKRGPSSKSGGR
jgi:hypothetical protein